MSLEDVAYISGLFTDGMFLYLKKKIKCKNQYYA